MLDQVIIHLSAEDIQKLRLVATSFRSHRAVLNTCTSTKFSTSGSMSDFQAGISFLQQLPKLVDLSLDAPLTLSGVGKLKQLTRLDISGCQEVLDLYPLASLGKLVSVTLTGCQAEQLANISELKSITELKVDQQGVHQHISRLQSLNSLAIWTDASIADAVNFPVYSSLSCSLTSLVDNEMSRASWHLLPHLVTLDIHTSPRTLQDVVWPSRLRALAIDTGVADGGGHILESLAPLSILSKLGYLDLTGQTLPLPHLGSLTMLVLQFMTEGDAVPDLSSTPFLQALELWLSDWDVVLPEMGDPQSLTTVYFNEPEEGSLLIGVNAIINKRSSLMYKPVVDRRSLASAIARNRT